MEPNDLITSILAILSTAATGGLAAVTARLRSAVAPQRARQRLSLCIVTTEEAQEEAASFRAQLSRGGYTSVRLTRAPEQAAGDVVVLWAPTADTAHADIAAIQRSAPEAHVLVMYRGPHLQPQPTGPRLLLANHPIRTRSDLEAVVSIVAAEQPA